PDPCPEPLRRILMKALAPDPEVRYATAAELGADLAAFRAGGPVAAVLEDLEATRRTYRRPTVEDDTRQTAAPAVEADTRRTVDPPVKPASGKPPAAAGKKRGDWYSYLMRGVGLVVALCVGYGLYAAVTGYQLYQRGQQFAHDLAAEQITDPAQIWDKWTELS